ncbi:MAG: nucleotidyltransferase family protein [Verrucomicrobia bacterium]|nr:nucleotidyltransferase family protein [Verrucomicrobiota bacterium]
MTDAFTLVAHCVTPRDTPPDELTACVRAVADWDHVLKFAAHHHVTPHVYRRLSQTCPDETPPLILTRLRHTALSLAARQTRMNGELYRIVDLLAANAIGARPIKGAIIAQLAYGDPTARQFDDADILIRPIDLLRARDLLLQGGYNAVGPLPREFDERIIAAGGAFTLKRPGGDGFIDLAASVTPRYFAFRLPDAVIWDHGLSITLDNHPIQTVSNEAQVLLLCAHGAKHLWSRLDWIGDLANLIIPAGVIFA